ncbi:3-phosphoshikimate 1-carboxyvinyltransferase [Litorimonas sp. RW-G-Af-16]|uniref:3-phosphoshikimate 1-carboxyvinyltransferase n=1 Tax=Litorimonas sp. RW-G-Af-16 TaxID=3241168 RepID=UPI00390C9634
MPNKPHTVSARKSGPLNGKVRAPGDKSISHRSLIFGAMAEGTTTVTGLLEGEDIMSTANAMRAFGADITRAANGTWTVVGVGKDGLQTPDAPVDCGNAGTGVRLIMGAAAGYALTATFTGDASLTSRPMNRILHPLRDMGVTYKAAEGGRLPVNLSSGGDLKPISYTPPHASAQVKSAILLAALNTEGVTEVIETTPTRDHSENMLRAFGVTVNTRKISLPGMTEGDSISVKGPAKLTATKIDVPGDPSSAAFPIVAALITPGSDVVVENVMMNPTRTGLFECLTEMGAYLRADNFRKSGGEVIADFHVRYSKLRGIVVPPHRAASMIDEYPILAVAAAYADGVTIMDEIGELRVKESDRISATMALLIENGVDATELKNGMRVRGGAVAGGATVKTHHDHRIAMSALVLGLAAANAVSIDDAAMIATSFPNFFEMMRGLGAEISE